MTRLDRFDAVALREQHLAVADDCDLHAGDRVVRHGRADDAVDERFEVRQRVRAGAVPRERGEQQTPSHVCGRA